MLPAEAIGSNAFVTRGPLGLSFPTAGGASGFAMVPIPPDWDRQSAFRVTIYFTPDTAAAGAVVFFTRVMGRKVGEVLNDPGGVEGAGTNVPASSNSTLFSQSIDVPANRVEADDDVFHLFSIQRGATGETFPDAVTIRVVEISYTAKR